MSAFVPLLFNELESTAYQKLTPSAAKLLPYFKRICVKATKGKPDDTTMFTFPYSQARKYGFSENTFSRAVRDLEEKGFIDIVEVGGLRGFGHTCSRYKLSKRWLTYGGITWAVNAEKERSKAQLARAR